MGHPRLKVGAVLLIAVLAVSGWYAFRPERAFIDVAVSEAMPPEALALQSSGQFVLGAHEGTGQAHIYRRADGSYFVRFSGFRTLNGPDVRVYLLGASNVDSRKQLADAGFLDLGPLKGNMGDQNYDVPAGTDPARYVAISVWCRRFGVNFTTAALQPARPGNGG